MYKEGSLTEEQAIEIIGKKMVLRITTINDWMRKNGYSILLHSTMDGCVEDILSSEGLIFGSSGLPESKEEIMKNCNISEKDLDKLEQWVKDKKQSGQISKTYETNAPVSRDTVKGIEFLSAKTLLEYNHNGGNMTVVFCVPKKQPKMIGQQHDEWELAISRRVDSYLRRRISASIKKDGSVEFKSRYFYPIEGILFVYDREHNKILINKSFNEEYFLDKDSPQKGQVKKGDLLRILAMVMQQFGSGSTGKKI